MRTLLLLLLLCGTASAAENVKISLSNDKDGIHVFFVEDGIGLHFQDLEQAKAFTDGNGGDFYEVRAREVVRTALKSDTALTTSKNSVTYLYEDAKSTELL